MSLEINTLAKRFGTTRENQAKAIFSTLFIAGNRLQTVFDKGDPHVTLKQFMLLTMVRQAGGDLTFTQLGKLLGCSRQNIKKLATALEGKGLVTIAPSTGDSRAAAVRPTAALEAYFQKMQLAHQSKLGLLFSGYSDGEIKALFDLFIKLYDGIALLEAADAEKEK